MTATSAHEDRKHIFLSLLLSLLVKIPISPYFYPFPDRDSGVFAYIGRRILNGDLPYRDVWDHKPPLIFYLNALGLKIAPDSLWGIWLLSVLLLAGAIFCSHKLLSKLFNSEIALVSTAIAMGGIPVLLGLGNLTTEYTLPLQFLALLLVWKFWNEDVKSTWKYLFIGALGGLALLTKQSSIGIWLSIGVILLFQTFIKGKTRLSIMRLVWFVFGIAIVVGLVALYFYRYGAFGAFWDQAFLYNFVYVGKSELGLMTRFVNLFTMREIEPIAVFHLGMIGAILALAGIVLRKGDQAKKERKDFFLLLLIDLLLEVLLTQLPDATYAHYYLTLLPTLTVFTGLSLSVLLSGLKNISKPFVPKAKNLFLALITLFASIPLLTEWYYSLKEPDQNFNKALVQFILQETQPDQTVLIWGAETAINFYTDRTSPSRYVYQYPLVQENYVTEEMILDFLSEIERNKPELIIDSARADMPFLQFPIESERINEQINKIYSQYKEAAIINGWWVIQLVEP